jgi:hypothetical protein
MDAGIHEFLNAKREALHLLEATEDFLLDIDGSVDAKLQSELQDVKLAIDRLEFASQFLVAWSGPFSTSLQGRHPSMPTHVDTRMTEIIDRHFPQGHCFHEITRRRIQYELARIAQATKQLRSQLDSGLSS